MNYFILLLAVLLVLVGVAYAFALYRQSDSNPWNNTSKIGLFSSWVMGAILYAIVLVKIGGWNSFPSLLMMAFISSAEMFVGGIKIFDNGFQEYLFPGDDHYTYCSPESDIFLILIIFVYCIAIITTVYFIANFFVRHANSKRWLSRNKPGRKSILHCISKSTNKADSDAKFIHVFFGDSENARHLIADISSNSSNLAQVLLVDYPKEDELDVDISLVERLRRLLSTNESNYWKQFPKVRVIKARKKLTEAVPTCIWEDLGLDSLQEWMIEDLTTLYLLSDNQDENIKALTVLLGDDALKAKKIYCHARRDIVTIEKENAIRSANQVISGHYPDIRFVDSSSLAIKQLLEDENNDKLPVHYVNIKEEEIKVAGKTYKQNAGYIVGHFNAMIIGFGEAGQDVLSYLAEQAAFIGSEEQKGTTILTEKAFHCDVYDCKVNEIYSHYMISHPWMDCEHAGVSTHEMNVFSEPFWNEFQSKLHTANYIVVCLGNDRLNLQTTIEIARRIETSKEKEKFCVLVKLSHPDKITSVTISNLNKAHNNHIKVFGRAEDIWRESFISEDAFEMRAKQYAENYEMSQVGNISLMPTIINNADWSSMEKPDDLIDWLKNNGFSRYSRLLFDLCYRNESNPLFLELKNMSRQEFCTYYKVNDDVLNVDESVWSEKTKSFPSSLVNWISSLGLSSLCARIKAECRNNEIIEYVYSLTAEEFAEWIHNQMIISINRAWDKRNYDIISSATSNNTRYEEIRKRSQDYANQLHAKTKLELMRGYILENARQISNDIPSQFDGKTLYAGNNDQIKAILERLAICEHLRWNASHIALGYIHGDKKDSIKRTHPCIQDFKDIDTYTQYYDWLVIKTTLKIYSDENS